MRRGLHAGGLEIRRVHDDVAAVSGGPPSRGAPRGRAQREFGARGAPASAARRESYHTPCRAAPLASARISLHGGRTRRGVF